MKRKSQCPECKGKLTQFGLNVDTGVIECPKCRAQFSPLNVLRDSDIVSFSKQFPPDMQEPFLIGLGFEKEPAHRTSEALVHGLIFFIMLISVFGSVVLAVFFHRITCLFGIIGGLMACDMIYDMYKSEEAYKWHRREDVQ